MFFRSPFTIGILAILAIQLLAAPPAQGQAQASCTFKLFPLPKPVSSVQVSGVNDFGTVVGIANGEAFIHFAGGGFSYYLPPGATGSGFFARNNSGVTTGSYDDASGNQHAFILKGSTLTQIVHPKAVPFETFVSGINRWNSTVGSYLDSR